MPKKTHTQCVLRKDKSETTSWIPTKFAKIGKIVDLKPEGPGWEVVSVGTTLGSKFVNARTQDHKHMRKMTDI